MAFYSKFPGELNEKGVVALAIQSKKLLQYPSLVSVSQKKITETTF